VHRTDEGVGLIEIVVALAFFAILFIPLANLLTTGDSAIAGAQNSRTAGGIADQQLAADQQSTFPGTWNQSVNNPAVWPTVPSPATCPSVNAVVGQAFQCQVVNGVPFYIFTVGGWCVLNSAQGGWGNGSVQSGIPPTYHVAVRVTWNGKPAANTQYFVDDSTEMPSNTGAPVPTTNVQSCPLGML
jgi:hypothetical protein